MDGADVGREEPSPPVKKRSRDGRTKYFIRIGEAQEYEKKEPVSLPDGEFIPVVPDVGSSDFVRPYLPTPGDIRRMFGSDKIDSEPEYARSVDPDWSRVRPTTPRELYDKVCNWKAVTREVLNKYRAIEAKRSKDEGKNFFPEIKRCLPRSTHRSYSANGKDGIRSQPVPGSNQGTSKLPESSSEAHDEEIINKNKNTKITFRPTKLNYSRYGSSINVVQKMDGDHWVMIDMMYHDIKSQKGIKFEHLHRCVNKIVQDIFGAESEFVLSTIHQDPFQRIVKLGKLMLNIYHEAMFSSSSGSSKAKTTKLVAPGVNSRNCSKKCIKVYTTMDSTNVSKSKKNYDDYKPENQRYRRCMACYFKKQGNEVPKKKDNNTNIHKPWNYGTSGDKIKGKSTINGWKPPSRMNKRAAKPSLVCPVTNGNSARLPDDDIPVILYRASKGTKVDKGMDNKSVDDCNKSESIDDIDQLFMENSEESYDQDTLDESEKESKEEQEDELNEYEAVQPYSNRPFTPPENRLNLAHPPMAISAKSIDISGGNSGAGDTNEAISSPESNYLVPTLYEEKPISFNFPIELVSPLESENVVMRLDESDRFFNSPANVLKFNNQLEELMLSESSKAIKNCTINGFKKDKNIDVNGKLEVASRRRAQVEEMQENKYYKYSRWMRLTDDCFTHKGCITFFVTLMLGLTSAYFCRNSFLNDVDASPGLRESVRLLLKTFLIGALRLVNGYGV